MQPSSVCAFCLAVASCMEVEYQNLRGAAACVLNEALIGSAMIRNPSCCGDSPLHSVVQRNVTCMCLHALCHGTCFWHIGCFQLLLLLGSKQLVQRVSRKGGHHAEDQLCILFWRHIAVQSQLLTGSHLHTRSRCLPKILRRMALK